jgi:Tetratricopeptide repeat
VFDAFISYSHAADGALAAALQQGLHRFAKPVFKLRAIRVFRDETTLAMTPKLWPEIEKALRDSRFFILMADPLSAKLEWVHKEVGCWLGMERADSMLIVWTGGRSPGTRPKTTLTGTAPLPCHRCLLGHSKVMSLFITISVGLEKELHLSRKHPGFATALAKLSASIRGRSLDEIFGDDVREQRRTRRFLWMGITVLLLATIFAGWRWWSELQARQEAESARDQGDRLINFMLFDLRDKLQPIGRLDVLDGVAEKAKRYLDSLPKELITAPRLRQQAVIRGNLGGVLAAQGKLPEALDLYQQSLAIAKRLAEQDKSDSGWQRNLSVSYVNVGNVLVAQGKLQDALDAYQQPDKARSNSAANLEDFFFPCPTTSNLKSRSNSES